MANILEFVAPIVLLIIIHEIGHFVVAKLFGVEIEEFGLGFPPRAVKLFTLGGTIYSLNWIPLGGFVRPKGENDPSVEGGLAAASPWVRIAVFLAGPLANLLVAVVLFGVLFVNTGRPDESRIQVFMVNENSPAAQAGMAPGDIISEINATKIDNPDLLVYEIRQNLEKDTVFTISRDGELMTINMVPRSNPPSGEGAIGIQFGHPMVPVKFSEGLYYGGAAVYDYTMMLFTIPARLIQGSMQPGEARLVGYKGMYDMYQSIKDTEIVDGTPAFINTLAFFATISVSLGLLNLLPIPAVDGGRILFALPEIVLRRRIPPDYENVINFLSFSLLILLMIYINFQDFVNPAQF